MSQANKMEELQQKIDEYERLSEEMTEDYEDTILSMCPWYIEKARVRNLTNKYGHQEWKPFVDKLIIEFLCDHVPPTCACKCYSNRFQQEIAQTRGEVRGEGKASQGEEAEGSNGRLHECIIPSPAI